MAYNDAAYNELACNVNRVFESGSVDSTATLTSSELTLAIETGTTTATGTLNGEEISVALENGTTTATATLNGIEIGQAAESGTVGGVGSLSIIERGVASESGQVIATGELTATDGIVVFESGTTTSTAAFDVLDKVGVLESGTITATGTVTGVERLAGGVRIHTRDVDLSFRVQREFTFNENKTMTEIQAIDDTITNETRILEFTATENGSARSLTDPEIEWSLKDKSGVVLDTSDSEVTVTVIDADNGRFNVTVDTIDAPAGVYTQRVELTDVNGRVTRSTGTYRLREF